MKSCQNKHEINQRENSDFADERRNLELNPPYLKVKQGKTYKRVNNKIKTQKYNMNTSIKIWMYASLEWNKTLFFILKETQLQRVVIKKRFL